MGKSLATTAEWLHEEAWPRPVDGSLERRRTTVAARGDADGGGLGRLALGRGGRPALGRGGRGGGGGPGAGGGRGGGAGGGGGGRAGGGGGGATLGALGGAGAAEERRRESWVARGAAARVLRAAGGDRSRETEKKEETEKEGFDRPF
jgi:hypothetical protein